MNLPSFTASLQHDTPPKASVYLEALWYDAKNNWKTAHSLIDHLEDKTAYWVHAYLHRKEGDLGNADYWYSRAGKKRPSTSLQREWEQLVTAMINEENGE
jgi:hypothetical protein